MAGTADNASTAERRLVLLAKEFPFILAHTESESLALAVVFAILQGGATAHDDGPPRFYFWTVEGLPMFQSRNPFEGVFWRSDPDKDIRVELDVKNSSGRWHGPRQFAGETPRELMVAEFRGSGGKLAPVDVRVLALTLRHDIVLAQLRFMSLLPSAAAEDVAASRMVRSPKEVFADLKEQYPQRADEDNPAYAERLHPLMRTQLGKGAWDLETLKRRVRDK